MTLYCYDRQIVLRIHRALFKAYNLSKKPRQAHFTFYLTLYTLLDTIVTATTRKEVCASGLGFK